MKTLKTLVLVAILCLGQIAMAQDTNFNDTVKLNPTANEDLKVVTDYMDALMTNDMKKVGRLLADTYVGNGPSTDDKQTKAEQIASWTETHKVRTNNKNSYVVNTWRVLSGDYKGDWVSVWGDYSYTENGKDVKLTYQFTANIEDGKIQNSIIYYDNLAIAKQMGYELTAAKKKD
ncbi:MAG: nuclear transport factor 2 family protein [Winogradskyella sp.]|uniref:nuclear transport factor 2 family protein n=1 Tax=Winogradskyella sp. TaxID=1883156 RepID=UPI00385932F1